MQTVHTSQKILKSSERISRLPLYIFATIAEQKKSLDPNWLIDLSLGSPDTPTPDPVLEELLDSSKVTKNHGYPPFDGKHSLKEEICKWFEQRFNKKIYPENVLPLIGSKEGLAHLPLAYLDPGDISLIPNPHYPVHYRGSIIAGADVYDMPLLQENNFLPNLKAIPAEISAKAKLMITSYPNNPTGAAATPEFMNELVSFVRKNNILLCNDLAYSEIYFDKYRPQSIFEYMSLEENAIEFFTFSKTYHMAGWRIGFCVGNKDIVNNLYTIKTNMDYGVSGTIQDAAIRALKMPEDYYTSLRTLYQHRAEKLYKALKEDLGWDVYKPQGAMYMWVPVPKNFNGNGTDFALELLQKSGVVTTPGHAFGEQGKNYVRIALVQPENKLEEAVKRLKEKFA